MRFRQKVILACEGTRCNETTETFLTVDQTRLGRRESVQCPKHWTLSDDYRHLCHVCKAKYFKRDTA